MTVTLRRHRPLASRTLSSKAGLMAGLTLAIVLGGTASAQDPFSAGERWSHAPAAAAPDWMPDEVLFAGDDSFVWSAQRGGDHALRLLDAVATGTQDARGTVARTAIEFGAPLIAAGTRGDKVFALRQFYAPTAYSRQPLLVAYDPRTAAAGAEMPEAWSHDLDVRINGPVRLAADRSGDRIVAAAWDDTTATVRLDVVNGTDGTLLGRRDLPAFSLNALSVSADGTRIAVIAGLTLYVLDATATPLYDQPVSTATQALALSSDGSVLAYGELGALSILQAQPGGGYAAYQRPTGSMSELPSRIDMSDDGSLIAIAWWDFMNGADARFEIYDTVFQFPISSYDQFALPGASQNLPIAATITADGHRAAFATWGNGVDPEVIVLGLGSFFPDFEVDLSGSSRGMALDATGTRLAIGHKDVHSQVFGSTGAVRVVDTGERRLALTNTPRIGGTLDAAAISPGSFGGWFVLGPKAAVPTQFPGVSGILLLQRNQLTVLGRPADSNGRIDLSLPIPNISAMVGTQMHVQAAFRTTQGLQFTENLVSPFLVQ
ncbi:hypothetical protein Poly30_40320 [Planctomycetes bacterium Poly30]|uniref:Uncharacterized protein n=1 Tax=Saltatorellus ferox TaxID=2528018 RepID=A0A518EWM2_9BACT|nr:hypothetical protein Poly30_40320 [Planctomycetes bacterium Poly30]